jgi:hypothetical protein
MLDPINNCRHYYTVADPSAYLLCSQNRKSGAPVGTSFLYDNPTSPSGRALTASAPFQLPAKVV